VNEAGAILEEALLQALSVSAEGLMLKFLDSRCAYEPSKRADSWLKLKKDYCEGLRDSLDLV
jgi:DNA ligase 1